MRAAADMTDVKLTNYRKVWDFVYQHGALTIPQISHKTGISLPTVTRAIEFSIEEGLMRNTGILGGERGRKAQLYELNPDYMHFLFLSLHCHKLCFQVHNFQSEVLVKGDFATEDDVVLTDIEKVIREQTTLDPLIRMIGITLSGTITDNMVYESYDYPSLCGTDLKGILQKEFGRIVFLENYLYAAVYAANVYMKDVKNKIVTAYLFGDVGYGSGTLIHGVLLRGASGSAGKLTNLVVTQEDRQCNEFYGEFLRSIAALMNPDVIILYPNGNADIPYVQACAFKRFKAQRIPDMMTGRDFTEDIFLGMKQMCKSYLLESDSEKSVLGLTIK